MGLETGTYPSDFVLTNPTAGDPVAQADDHMRLIKTCVQNALPIGAPNYPLTSVAAVTASGTSLDFTSIPSWVKRITILLGTISTNGTSIPMVQIGDSGGIETSGYLGACANIENTSTLAVNGTTGFLIAGSVIAASTIHATVTLTLLNPVTNQWSYSVSGGLSNGAVAIIGGGSKSLSATLDRVRVTTVNGTDTFDTGAVSIQYE